MERGDSLKDDHVGTSSRYHHRASRHRRQPAKGNFQKWVQCTLCKKWRQVPFDVDDSVLGDHWVCRDNEWDPTLASCDKDQTLTDEQIDAILRRPDENGAEAHDPQDSYPSQEGYSVDLIRTNKFEFDEMKTTSPFLRHSQSGVRSISSFRSQRYERNRRSPNSSPTKRDERIQSGDMSVAAEALLTLGSTNTGSIPSSSRLLFPRATPHEACKFAPGDLVWGKVEGHEWWPAKVVRRRSVPSEVGPLPGGASEVMYYIPVVFFTSNGIPKEVELAMDSEQFPIALCQRANGLIEEDEAEYAWLSVDNIRPFRDGDTNGKKDGSEVNDLQLQRCIEAAHGALSAPDPQLSYWKENEDSDGGWCCAAAFNRNRQQQQKHKKTTRRKSKRLDEVVSDVDSGADGGPELMVYGNGMLTPKIAVEHIYAWRQPLSHEQMAKEAENEQEEKKINLQKLKILAEKLKNQEPISTSTFDTLQTELAIADLEKPSLPARNTDEGDLVQQEREAVSALMRLGPFNEVNREPIISSMDEVEYFVKYSNRSHIHNEWVNESTLMKIAKRKLTPFRKKYCDGPIDMFNEDWLKPERIITRRKSRTGPGWELLIKWTDMGIEDCTWETESGRILSRPETVLLYIELWKRQKNAVNRNSKAAIEKAHDAKESAQKDFKFMENPIPWLHGCQLHKHQIEVLDWSRSCWIQNKGGILTGELGQGRTASLVAFLQCLREDMKCVKPFLVVVPSSHISKWAGEIHFWSEQLMDTVQYHGPHSSKHDCLEHEIWQSMECLDVRFPTRETEKNLKADVVIMSSDMLSVEKETLQEVPWDVVILDLRWVHRNNIEKLINTLPQIQCPHFIAACELPSSESTMMNILKLVNSKEAAILPSLRANEEVNNEDHYSLKQLRDKLDGCCHEVQSSPKPVPDQTFREHDIALDFKPEQREQYKECLVRHYDTLREDGTHRYSASNVATLRSIVEELCLVCQHPLLLDEEDEALETADLDSLVASSGKLEALGNLLEALRDAKINTLLLTHTQKCFTLLVKYVKDQFGDRSFESMSIINSTAEQHASIQDFNLNSSFLFLTTGECCGLGMDLHKINCVLIFESVSRSDDLVSLKRAFQIGTVQELMVFRFFIAGSVEEKTMQTSRRSDSKGNSHEMKILEDILVSGTLGLFENIHGIQRHPYMTSNPARTTPAVISSDYCQNLVQNVINFTEEGDKDCDDGIQSYRSLGKSKDLDGDQGMVKTVDDILKDNNGSDFGENVRHANDPLLVAGYWEQLLQTEWNIRRQQEEMKYQIKRVGDEMEIDVEKDLGSDADLGSGAAVGHENVENGEEVMKIRNFPRKRIPSGQDFSRGPRVPKKQKSLQKLDQGTTICIEDSINDETKWCKEALRSSKAHQDVLAQLIANPTTPQGKAIQEAYNRIDSISRDLSLPINSVHIAKVIAEILLTLREDHDRGAYFRDYTILAIIALACFLCAVPIGEKYGIKELALKYSQEEDLIEQVFEYILQIVIEYKQMLLKINEMTHQRIETNEETTSKNANNVVPCTTNGATVDMETNTHPLHQALDGFLAQLNEAVKTQESHDVEDKLQEILNQPPGAPIKGHVPHQWFPPTVASESAHLTKRARHFDAEMYVVENSCETRTRKIEKAYRSFQEKTREYAMKALDRICYETTLAQREIKDKRAQMKQLLNQNQTSGGISSPNVSSILAAFQQSHQETKQDTSCHIITSSAPNLGSNENGKSGNGHTNVAKDIYAHFSSIPSSGTTVLEVLDYPQGSAERHPPPPHPQGPVPWRPSNTNVMPRPHRAASLSLEMMPMSTNQAPGCVDKSPPKAASKIVYPNISRVGTHNLALPPHNAKAVNRPYQQAWKPAQGSYGRLSFDENVSTCGIQVHQKIHSIPSGPAQQQPHLSAPTTRIFPQTNQLASANPVSGTFGSMTSVLSNYSNYCVIPTRVPHPTVPGISCFSVQSCEDTSTGNGNNMVPTSSVAPPRASSSFRMTPNVLDGPANISFVPGRQKSIHEAPSVRVEPTPSVSVVISQPSPSTSFTDWTTSSTLKTFSTGYIMDQNSERSPSVSHHLPTQSSHKASYISEDGSFPIEKQTESIQANATITTGGTRPLEVFHSKQTAAVESIRGSSKTHSRPGHPVTMENISLDAGHLQDMRSSHLGRNRAEVSAMSGPMTFPAQSMGHDKGVNQTSVNPAWSVRSQSGGSHGHSSNVESQQGIKIIIGPTVNSVEAESVQESRNTTLATAPENMHGIEKDSYGSLSSTITAVASSEARSGSFIDVSGIQIIPPPPPPPPPPPLLPPSPLPPGDQLKVMDSQDSGAVVGKKVNSSELIDE